MPTVMYPAYPVFDPATGEPLLTIRGEAGRVVQRGTETDVTLVDSNGLSMSQPLYVTDSGFLPTFGVVEGLTQVDFLSGSIRMPITSPTGLEAAAAESAADADASRIAAEAAAGLVNIPADAIVATMVTDVRTLTGAAVLERFTSFVSTVARDSEPMTKWSSALASAGSSPAKVVVIGDSISEGTGASTVTNRWQTVMQTALRGGATGASIPFIPAWPQSSVSGFPVTRSGNVGQNSTTTAIGLGWRGADLRDDTAVLTFTFTGDRCKAMVYAASSTGIMSIQIDGGTPTLVNTQTPTMTAGQQTWDSGALTSGAHTVVIRRSATSPAGNYVYVQGLLTFNGDLTAGVRVLDAARHGINSAFVSSARANGVGGAIAATGGAQLAIIGLGTNDYSVTTPAAFKANIEILIAGLRSNGFTGSILLLGMYLGGGRDNATWSTYLDQYAAIATTDPDVYFLDLRDYMPPVPTPSTEPSGLGYYNDSLHPTDLGYARMGRVLAARLKGVGMMELLALRAAV